MPDDVQRCALQRWVTRASLIRVKAHTTYILIRSYFSTFMIYLTSSHKTPKNFRLNKYVHLIKNTRHINLLSWNSSPRYSEKKLEKSCLGKSPVKNSLHYSTYYLHWSWVLSVFFFPSGLLPLLYGSPLTVAQIYYNNLCMLVQFFSWLAGWKKYASCISFPTFATYIFLEGEWLWWR